jgi:ATP-dependent helicase/nuclease subunit B
MSDRPAVYTIPAHRAFADSLAAGLIQRFGKEPLALAEGRILLPNNRAVRAVTDAFVRASGGGLLLPRLIPIGDPELDERIGGALDPIDEPLPPAIDPLVRLLALADILRTSGTGAAEALRLARDLARTLDALHIEEVDPQRLTDVAMDSPELAVHWQVSLDRLRAIVDLWPRRLAELGRIDLADRRNRLLRRLAQRWDEVPPPGFTVAAGVTTAAPAVAALLKTIAFMPTGSVVLPALSLRSVMPDEEWESLGPDDKDRGERTHPQFHLKLLLDRMGIGRDEVEQWPSSGPLASPAVRGRAVANAMTVADFSDKWSGLKPAERRLTGIRSAEFADSAAEAQGIALAIREALEMPGRTAALITPDRKLAARVSALLERWGIDADDSAGQPLSETPVGTLLLAIAAAAAEELAPVPLLALLKHPLAGGEGEERVRWLDSVRSLDLALRGPRPAAGIAGLDAHIRDCEAESKTRGCAAAWARLRPAVEPLDRMFAGPMAIGQFAGAIAAAVKPVARDRAWAGSDGRMAAELLAELEAVAGATTVEGDDAVPLLRQLLDLQRVRPAYGGHPRLSIWGLLEARLQHADMVILGGLNEGTWPAPPAPDPWLAPRVRADLGLPNLEYRVGLSAHDFASALGAPRVLVTRARRDARSPTVASRFWLRLQAMTGGVTRDVRLERLAAAIDDPVAVAPADRPAPSPAADLRPRRISVTAVDRLKADPFAFYAQAMLGLRRLDPIDAEHSAAWRGTAVHKVLEEWFAEDECDAEALLPRAEALLRSAAMHPMLRALWLPRLLEAIESIQKLEQRNRERGRRPLKAEITGEVQLAAVTVHGKADRIDRLASGGLAIIDYKTGAPPSPRAVEEGFALQLGLLGLIARGGGFPEVSGQPECYEYWSLARRLLDKNPIPPAKDMTSEQFLDHACRNFVTAAEKWLTGNEPFTAKLHPAYAPYGDYDQLMRLEEWYGRE